MSNESVQVKLRVPRELDEWFANHARKQFTAKSAMILEAVAFHAEHKKSAEKSAARWAANDECVNRLKREVELPIGAGFIREMSADDVDETLAIWRPGVPTEPIAHIKNGQVVESTKYVPTIW